MHLQTLISILVWVAVNYPTHVVANNMNESQQSELANKLNMLLNHSGWRSMDVKLVINEGKFFADPISEIIEALSSNRNPVNESNALKRHKEIWAVLLCKYSEIVSNYKVHILNLTMVCKNEKSTSDSFQRYYDCFRLLLIKLHSMSPMFKCMMDALAFIFSLGPPTSKGQSVMDAMQNLADYTSTLGPTISSKLSEHGTTVEVVDHEINNIEVSITNEHKKNIYFFMYRNCTVPKHYKILTTQNFRYKFMHAKNDQLIPQESTMVQYVIDEIDSYINENLSKWFYDLGFAYGVGDIFTIRNN